MYIRVLSFQTNGEKKTEATAIINHIIPKIRAMEGYKDCLFLTDGNENRYVFLVFWQTKENADTAAPVIGPMLIPALNKISTEPVVPRLYEVYEFEEAMV
jgi:hypothetical protein